MSRKKKKNRSLGTGKPAPGEGARTPRETSPGISEGGGPRVPLLRVAQALIGGALLISLYLAYTSLSAAPLAGCGAGSNCDAVLSSRWAHWFGVPVSLPAAGVYVALLITSVFAGASRSVVTQRRAWNVLVAGAFVVLAAALWFVGLQGVILEAWCKYCTTAHALGAGAAVLILMAAPFVIRHGAEPTSVYGVTQRAWPALLGMMALAPLVIGQYLSDPPAATVVIAKDSTTRVEPAAARATDDTPATPVGDTRDTGPETAPSAPSTNAEPSRLFVLHDRYQFDLYSVPLLGHPAAPHVIVSLFDYTCSHCRHMHERLVRVQELYEDELAIVLMPMPLDASCNPLLTTTGPEHVNACQYARIALALFKEKEERFNEFEDWFFEPAKPRPLNEVLARAREWSGVEDFDAVVGDPGIEAWIKLGIQVFQDNYNKTGQRILPMLNAGPAVLAGQVNSDEALIDFLVTNLGLPKKESTNSQ